jgi:hypothetical protein
MNTLKYPLTTKYVVIHNGEDFCKCVTVKPDQEFLTGQPFMDVFDSEEEARNTFPQAFENLETSANETPTN